MKNIKDELNIIKEIIEIECGDKVRLLFAEKEGWLLIKTADKNKGIGAIRLNKKSFLTIYLDTKQGYLLSDKIYKLPSLKEKIIDINSKTTGNFVQNKIKLFNEDAIDFVIDVINMIFDEDGVKTGKRIRQSSNNIAAI